MKKAILALALVMSIGATQVSLASSAPKHRYHPTTQFKGCSCICRTAICFEG